MNKKWAFKRITVNLTENEAKKLEEYCDKTGRAATDVIRELLRGLPTQQDSTETGFTSSNFNVNATLVNP
ncbi:MAG: ribbon-helix-helix protein, CopG family [Rhizonema sp. PD37]|nr:ribbon-helix-helix protein, CopG family [Rhizonema sp. PD37]